MTTGSFTRRLVALATVLLLVVPAVSSTQAAAPARGHKPTPVHRAIATLKVAGNLTTISGSVLTVTTAQNVAYTVNVSSTTKIVRLYNGTSALDELSPGDALLVWGPTGAVSTTINATQIKDQSIQRAFTRMVGIIGGMSGSVITATVTFDHSGVRAPFGVGQVLTLDIAATTKVISPTASSVMTGTAALSLLAANVGSHITLLGVYNRVQKSFTTVDRIRLLKAKSAPGATATPTPAPASSATATSTPVPGATATSTSVPGATATSTPGPQTPVAGNTAGAVGGTIVSVPGLTAPTSLTLQSPKYGLVTVTIAASPAVAIVRRFNGRSELDELSPGDTLEVKGAFTDSTNKTFAATTIRDTTIQEAATRAVLQVSAQGLNTTTSSFSGVVMHDVNSVLAPFDEGATVTVTVNSATKILVPATAPATGAVSGTTSNIQANQTVTVLGVYNRQTKSYISTLLVRIHG
jgi:hypothetical protein